MLAAVRNNTISKTQRSKNATHTFTSMLQDASRARHACRVDDDDDNHYSSSMNGISSVRMAAMLRLSRAIKNNQTTELLPQKTRAHIHCAHHATRSSQKCLNMASSRNESVIESKTSIYCSSCSLMQQFVPLGAIVRGVEAATLLVMHIKIAIEGVRSTSCSKDC